MIKFLTSVVIAVLPFSYIKIFGNFSYIDLSLIAIFLFLLFDKKIQRYSIREYLSDNCFIIPITIYSIGFFLSWSYSLNYYDSFLSYLQVIFIFIIIYPIFFLQHKDESFIYYSLYGLSVLTSLITCFLIMYFFIGFDFFNNLLYIQKGWGNRFSYGNYEPNVAARIMAQCVPILLFSSYKSKNHLIQIFNYLLISLLITGIVLTASRTGLLILVLGILLYIIFSFRISLDTNRLKLLFPIISFIFISIYAINEYPDTLARPLERYYTIFSPEQSYSSKERMFVLSKSIDKINANPFIGYGMGNSHNITGVSVHNPIILSWVENGIFGLLGFILLYVIFFIQIIKDYFYKFYNNKILMILSIVTLMMIVGDMFMANSYKRSLWVLSLLYLAYSFQLSNLFFFKNENSGNKKLYV